MLFQGYTLFHDSFPATEQKREDNAFLLDEYGTILAARTADGDLSLVGSSFFRSFHVLREEQAEACNASPFAAFHPLLFLAGERPAMACRSFLGRTRLLAVWMPEGDVRQCLARPAAYAELFTAYGLQLSKAALAAYAPQDEMLYLPTAAWLQSLHTAIFYQPAPGRGCFYKNGKVCCDINDFVEILTLRTRSLAEMIGIGVDYDWNGIGFADIDNPDFEALTAILFTLFLTVHRVAKERTCTLWLTREGLGGLTVSGYFTMNNTEDALAELHYLKKDATERGEVLVFFPHPDDPTKLLFSFSACRKELSNQEFKTPIPILKTE